MAKSNKNLTIYLAQYFYILYQSAFNNAAEGFIQAGEQWKVSAVLLPVYALQGSSCYFVALVALLRLLAVKHPLAFRATHKKLSKFITGAIWIALLLLAAIIVILSFLFHKLNAIEEQTFVISGVIAFQVFFSLPILSTVIMYGALLYTLRQKKADTTQAQELIKSTSKLTKWIVICLLICNIPWMLWTFYTNVKYPSGGSANVFDTTFGV